MSHVTTIRTPATSTRRGNDPASGCKTWMKMLSEVDPGAKNAFGFEGDFVQRGALLNSDEIPEGAVLLEAAGNDGSAKNTCAVYVLWQRRGDQFVECARAEGKEWAFELRGKAAELLNPPQPAAASTICCEASPEVVRLVVDLQRALIAEKALWAENRGSLEAIDDALMHLEDVARCIRDINDGPASSDEDIAQEMNQ